MKAGIYCTGRLVSPIMTIVTMIGVVDLYTSLRKVIIMKDGEKK